ncbi:TonB-dependent receptor plug domain-containing protein [Pseudoalteromonas luteoviolacea]|uniref:Putative Fe transport outer membrane receptor protein n=1 Tax=Pseudoalteromonas luteoviolacea (strain 2ta16) TaxID=1353533 RepID=V4HQX8_PSEL2|nr:TonB-dependent receptor [Pseudoalteromonas luteoviolacea]ESP93245.1 putative Fe transport outer membrane receptor protein [Pseudoalteromonas luteoviolacea 2ta16]KZN36636.1 adhesin [Pseudoalteromonas luteoviolacea NCIMB 1944]
MTQKHHHKNLIALMCSAALLASSATYAQNEQPGALMDLSLEDLLNLTVSSASGIEETLRDAPAAMVIITAKDIEQRGYTSIDEVILDLPGFDSTVTNGNGGVITYQRGYRTPLTQRTLMLVNGIVDNHLWYHEATLSKNYPLSNIERIEVLYGPVGAVYGPNAFLGIINLVTSNAEDRYKNDDFFTVNVQSGSYDTQSVDLAAGGNHKKLTYNLSAKYYSSDEADIDDLAPWGFVSNELLSNRDIWGPVIYDTALSANCDADGCPHSSKYNDFGSYHDPQREWGILADVKFKNLTFGIIEWDMRHGWGPQYPHDRAQPAAQWYRTSEQYYLRHVGSLKDKVKVDTMLLSRKSNNGGYWVESFPGSTALTGPEVVSTLTISHWRTSNKSWLFKQDYEFDYSEQLKISGGIKFEDKELTKAYDACGYFPETFCSSDTPETAGDGVALNTDSTINIQPDTLSQMPDENLASLTDRGAYIQAIWNINDWRINAGLRHDKNSLYGSTTNPRASAIYFLSHQSTIKLLYGTAFQEPAPIQLWGGWSGRSANPNLKPEKAKNFEVIYMYQQDNWLHDLSLFTARYDDVIKEEAENAGKRSTYGLEYRGKFEFSNFITDAANITGYLYYTYTKSKSSVSYDHDLGVWVGEGIENCSQIAQEHSLSYDPCSNLDAELGDISPHKINVGINVPVSDELNVNVKANWVASKPLYLRNALRAKQRENDAYLTVDANISYQFESFSVALKVKNLFDEIYYHSGAEAAASGDDFEQRSQGWANSLIPQPKRSFMLTLSMQF